MRPNLVDDKGPVWYYLPDEDSPQNEDEEPVVNGKDEEDLQSNLGDDEHPLRYYMPPEESLLARLWLASEKLLARLWLALARRPETRALVRETDGVRCLGGSNLAVDVFACSAAEPVEAEAAFCYLG